MLTLINQLMAPKQHLRTQPFAHNVPLKIWENLEKYFKFQKKNYWQPIDNTAFFLLNLKIIIRSSDLLYF